MTYDLPSTRSSPDRGSTADPPGSPVGPAVSNELTAAVMARRELGSDYDDLFLDTVIKRLDETVRDRVATGVAVQLAHDRELAKGERAFAITLFCVTMGAAIPLTAIAVGTVGLIGLVIAWVCLTVINVGYAHRIRRR